MGGSIKKLEVVPIFDNLWLMLLVTKWFGEPSYKVNDLVFIANSHAFHYLIVYAIQVSKRFFGGGYLSSVFVFDTLLLFCPIILHPLVV